MGSGNSSPVKQARNVETEAHQDVFELRFDHMAMGGTVFIILMALILAYWCRHRKKMKRLKRQTQRQTQQTDDTPCSGCQQRWYPVMPPMMPSIMHPMMPMEVFPPRYTRNDDSARFMEIDEAATRRIPSAPARMPTRPPQPIPPRASLPSPSQHRAADQAN